MAFVKRARLPQAEDSAPMRVSRISPSGGVWGGSPIVPSPKKNEGVKP